MEIKSWIIAHAPFCVPRFHDFQNGAYAMISLLSSMEITFLQKMIFPLLPGGFLEVSRRHGFQENAFWHTFLDAKVCRNANSEFRGERESHFDTLLHLKKCVKIHFSEIHAADWPPETLLGVMENSLFCKMWFHGTQKWNHSVRTVLGIVKSGYAKWCMRYDSTFDFHKSLFLTNHCFPKE